MTQTTETIIEEVLENLNSHLVARFIQSNCNDTSLLLMKAIFTHSDLRAQVLDFHPSPFSVEVIIDDELYLVSVNDKGKFVADVVK